MGLLNTLVDGFTGRLQAADDRLLDDSYFTSGPVFPTATGLTVTPERALQVSAVFRAIVIIADLSTLPLITYRRLPNGGKDRLVGHAVGDRIRTKGKANTWQTGEQWRHQMLIRAALWGIGLSEMIWSSTGEFAGFLPLDNEHCNIEQLTNGRIRCKYTPPGEPVRIIPHERLYRLHGPGGHAFLGADILALAREAVGLWLATERFGSLYFARGATPGLAISVEGRLTDPARKAAREHLQQMTSGWLNHWRPLLLENKGEIKQFGFNAKDSQLAEAREHQVYDIARWFGVPARMLQVSRPQSSGSAEQDARELVDYTLRPWATRVEGTLQRDAIAQDDVECEHLLDGLLRGNTRDRFDAYAVAVMNGIFSENEVRLRENLNPVPGLDEPRRSVNQDRGAEPRRGESRPQRQDPDDEPDDGDQERHPRPSVAAEPPRRLLLIAEAAAHRIVGREKAALRDRGAKLAGKGDAWSQWLAEFYGEHLPGIVGETLQLEPAVARGYCARRRAVIEAGGLQVADEQWETDAVNELVALATAAPGRDDDAN